MTDDDPTPPSTAPVGGAGPAGSGARADGPRVPVLDDARTQFVEQFALVWATAGNPRMEGRIMGLLMILDEPYLSSTQIATMLYASAGAVSTSTRQLVDVGFLKRHVIPGDRNHYFRVEDDIWGSFLAGERHYLQRLRDVIDTGFDVLPGDGARTAPAESGPRLRLSNAQLYLRWLQGYNARMLSDWRAYRDAALAAPPSPEDETP